MKNIFKLSFILQMLLGFVLFSCTSKYESEIPTASHDTATATFVLNVPDGSVPSTRGLSEDDETNIETIDVLLFRKAGDDRLYYGNVLGVSLDDSPGNAKSFKAIIPVKDYNNYDISIIANGRDVLLGAGLSRGEEKSVVLNKLIKAVPTGQKWNSNKIPMWGEALNVDVNENTSLSGANAVKMTRMIARIDVKLSKKAATGSDEATATGNANFELVSVRLYNYSTRGTIVPNLVNGWYRGDSPKATAPNQPEGGYGKALYGDGNEPLVYMAADQHASAVNLPDSLIRAIYTLEAPKGSGSTLATNTCLVIGGRYRNDSKETFYRIDFAQKNSATQQYEYLHLLRNFRYMIHITKITGAGFVTPDEAFNSRPLNIETDILEWNDVEIGDIIYDGQHYLGVNPTEFFLYKDAKTDNKITVSTDVAAGWSVSGITNSDRPVIGSAVDWIYDIEGSFSTAGNKDILTFKAGENETGSIRYAWIHIKAGRLNFAVKVTQSAESDPDNYRITITDADNIEVGELNFTGETSVTPAPQKFKVQWNPSGSLLRATLIPNAANPMVADYLPGLSSTPEMLSWEASGHTYTVAPSAVGTSSEPFFEKSAKVLFELQTPKGPITKILALRQTNFNLVPQIGMMLMDGKSQSFRVRSNFTWKAEFVSASSEDAPSFVDYNIVKTFKTQYGGNNTTTGDIVAFTCKDFISDYKDTNPKKAVVKVKFSRLDKNQWVEFGTYDITCYSAVPVGESNCYMIDNARPVPILIPISQVNYAMKSSGSGFLGSGWITDYGKLKVQVLWSDVNRFGTQDAVVNAMSYNGATNVSDGKIVVVPGSGAGNSLIILYEDNNGTDGYQHNTTDRIRWSWHIWNTTYHPYDANGNPSASGIGNKWMDRNLGAMSNTPKDVKAMGFLYQWGRKDPFPSNSQWNSTFQDYLYYAAGSGLDFTETETPAATNLPNSVLNPLTRYYNGSSPYDWFTNTTGTQNDNLWGGGTKTDFLHASGKSVYDPCPEGYQVPKNGADGWGTASNEASWQTFANYGRMNDNYGGYYPAPGGRNHNKAGLDGYIGNGGYYWQNKTNNFTGGYYMHMGDSKVDPNVVSSRAYGYSVRCIAQ